MTDICDSMANTMRGMYPGANEDDKMRIERDLNAVRSFPIAMVQVTVGLLTDFSWMKRPQHLKPDRSLLR